MKNATALGFVLALAVLAGAALAEGLPKGPGVNLVYAKCQTCHDLQYLYDSKGISKADWEDLVHEMEGYGLQLTPDEEKKIIAYLGTYMGPNPPKPAAAEASAPAKLDGAKLYAQNCAGCHQAQGQGVPGAFPPLAKNPELFNDDYPALVVLFGLQGPIEVNGQKINSAMPPFGHLSDAEIAAIVNYVRGAWGNDKLAPKDLKPLTPEKVAELRKQALTPAKVHELRK
jgi:mono/diheme cytochrome c family protein